jgi:hypothetical protein
MECRFRNLQSPKYLGSDKRFKARKQEGVSAQRKRQGFDVAVNPTKARDTPVFLYLFVTTRFR